MLNDLTPVMVLLGATATVMVMAISINAGKITEHLGKIAESLRKIAESLEKNSGQEQS